MDKTEPNVFIKDVKIREATTLTVIQVKIYPVFFETVFWTPAFAGETKGKNGF